MEGADNRRPFGKSKARHSRAHQNGLSQMPTVMQGEVIQRPGKYCHNNKYRNYWKNTESRSSSFTDNGNGSQNKNITSLLEINLPHPSKRLQTRQPVSRTDPVASNQQSAPVTKGRKSTQLSPQTKMTHFMGKEKHGKSSGACYPGSGAEVAVTQKRSLSLKRSGSKQGPEQQVNSCAKRDASNKKHRPLSHGTSDKKRASFDQNLNEAHGLNENATTVVANHGRVEIANNVLPKVTEKRINSSVNIPINCSDSSKHIGGSGSNPSHNAEQRRGTTASNTLAADVSMEQTDDYTPNEPKLTDSQQTRFQRIDDAIDATIGYGNADQHGDAAVEDASLVADDVDKLDLPPQVRRMMDIASREDEATGDVPVTAEIPRPDTQQEQHGVNVDATKVITQTSYRPMHFDNIVVKKELEECADVNSKPDVDKSVVNDGAVEQSPNDCITIGATNANISSPTDVTSRSSTPNPDIAGRYMNIEVRMKNLVTGVKRKTDQLQNIVQESRKAKVAVDRLQAELKKVTEVTEKLGTAEESLRTAIETMQNDINTLSAEKHKLFEIFSQQTAINNPGNGEGETAEEASNLRCPDVNWERLLTNVTSNSPSSTDSQRNESVNNGNINNCPNERTNISEGKSRKGSKVMHEQPVQPPGNTNKGSEFTNFQRKADSSNDGRSERKQVKRNNSQIKTAPSRNSFGEVTGQVYYMDVQGTTKGTATGAATGRQRNNKAVKPRYEK